MNRDALLQGPESRNIDHHLADEHIGVLGEFGGELIGQAVAGPDEGQAVPVQPVGRRAVHRVRAPPMAHGHAILFIADAAVILVVKLSDFNLEAVPYREAHERLGMPAGHLLQRIDHRFGAELGRAPGRAYHPQGLPTHRARTERVDIG